MKDKVSRTYDLILIVKHYQRKNFPFGGKSVV